MNKLQRWIGAGIVALVIPVAAAAQEAFVRSSLNLRAGPSTNYPVVALLGPGQPLEVLGCTNGYGWCDVVLPDGLRGWVAAASLDYAYQEQRVPLATYGAAIGVPIVGFVIGNYWADHYRDRSWYGDRRWWGGRPPPPAAGWRPPPPPRPSWRPNPWRDPGYGPGRGPGYGPRPDQGFRPPRDGRPDQGFRPPRDGRPDPGFRPPRDGRPGPGFVPPGGGQNPIYRSDNDRRGGRRPDDAGGRPPGGGRPDPGFRPPGGGRPDMGARPPGGGGPVPGVPPGGGQNPIYRSSPGAGGPALPADQRP